jgi:disulfide bond formation protein DsbB
LDWTAEHWPVLAFAASAFMLGAAHAFETFGKLAPCLLCLKQREVYWIVGTVALVAVVLSRTAWAARVRRPLILLLGVGFLYGAGLAAYHAGAEWKWWPGPAACAAGGGASADDLVAMLKGAKIAAPSCDKAVWVFLGLSMAGWNAVISLALAVASFAAGLTKPKTA